MKRVKVKDLKVGDVFMHVDTYLVVVDEGEDFMGKTMDVVVTSVLQTTAGRMIFTRLKEAT